MPLQLSALYTYPIKSLGGVALERAKVTDRGLQYDRRWLLVDDQNCFLTQREHPNMALLRLQLQADSLQVSHSQGGIEPLQVPFQPQAGGLEVDIWGEQCSALEVSKEANAWFSQVLGQTCKLVYMPQESHRLVDPDYARHQELTSFSDGYPFLLIGQASLDELNARLEVALPMNRFRPNLVFSGGIPYQEDHWKGFSVADLLFYCVKPCARCIVITTDQETGVRGKEPLATLSAYRKQGNKVLFGQNLLHEGQGTLAIGDKLQPILT
jgi:uncharacterized protein YcbX